jgi:hypothetical protein
MRFVMTTNRARGLVPILAIVITAGALGRVSGQAIPAAATPVDHRVSAADRSDDVLPALLVEVKGLRTAMEQLASAGPRVQLFVSRLQLQEGRIAGMVRRLDTVRDTLAGARRELEQIKGVQKMMEGGGEPQAPGGEKEDFGPMLVGVRKQVAAAQANVDRLVAEETQLTQDVAAEQSRWVEISQRLDELERALAAKR